MKIAKRQLLRLIREEAADCAKDYRLGTLSREEYEDCLKRFEEPDDYNYRSYPPRKTSYVGADANQDKIAAVQAAIAAKPNNFLQSVLSQLQRGRGLSSKQNAIVKKILTKSDPEAARLFEGSKMKITKRQLRRIIKEERAKLLRESMEELPPPGADRKKLATTDMTILLEDHIQMAVYEGLEELGLDENGANEVIRGLYNRPDLLKDAIVNALNDYKRKLKMTGKPKPRNVDLFK